MSAGPVGTSCPAGPAFLAGWFFVGQAGLTRADCPRAARLRYMSSLPVFQAKPTSSLTTR